MSVILPYIILGLTSGSVYGMAGVGLVVTYKTSGVFNFAFGAIGTLGAYVFYILNVQHGIPWPVAALAAVIVLGLVLGVGFEILARQLARQALAIRIVATIGIVLLIQGIFLVFMATTRSLSRHSCHPLHMKSSALTLPSIRSSSRLSDLSLLLDFTSSSGRRVSASQCEPLWMIRTCWTSPERSRARFGDGHGS